MKVKIHQKRTLDDRDHSERGHQQTCPMPPPPLQPVLVLPLPPPQPLMFFRAFGVSFE